MPRKKQTEPKQRTKEDYEIPVPKRDEFFDALGKAADRTLLAALARFLPRERWFALLVRPETVRRWHRDAIARRWTYPRRIRGVRRSTEPFGT